MEIALNLLKNIPELTQLNVKYDKKDSKFVSLISSHKDNFEFTGTLDNKHIAFLGSINVPSIPVISNKEFLDFLRKRFPSLYPTPNLTLSMKALIQRSEEYLIMNTKTQKRRRITILQDDYYYDIRLDRQVKIIPYNSFISEKSIEAIKKYIDHDQPIEVIDSEEGALVFIPDVKDFKLKVDLFAILSTFDFTIYDSTSIKEAMEIYKEKNPKLVIIANLETNTDSKEFLIDLEEFDPYVKKMNFNESPAANRNQEMKRVKHHYDAGYKEIIEMIKDNDSKENLPEEIKKTILNNIQELESKYSPAQFYEKAFALKQFGRYFNIKMYWNMMLNIKKKKQ